MFAYYTSENYTTFEDIAGKVYLLYFLICGEHKQNKKGRLRFFQIVP